METSKISMNTIKEPHQQNVQRAKHANKSASQEGPQTPAPGLGPSQESTHPHDQRIKKNPNTSSSRQHPIHPSRSGVTFQAMKASPTPVLRPQNVSYAKPTAFATNDTTFPKMCLMPNQLPLQLMIPHSLITKTPARVLKNC